LKTGEYKAAVLAAFLVSLYFRLDWYNFHVPTPFYHLHLAEELIHHPELPKKISTLLHTWRCAFLFGSTAPDVQVISGGTRQQTHFFNLPVQADDIPAWQLMLVQYPQLKDTELLSDGQTAFIAGYLCHLQADWLWVKDLFTPVFGPDCTWGTFRQRLYYHNVLRTYLDLQTLPKLCPGMDGCLSQVEPKAWLPFVDDWHLRQWRDLISCQLEPGAIPQTVEVFSSRQGISAPEYYDLLESDERMQTEVFAHISLRRVQTYRQRIIQDNLALLSDYLVLSLHPLRKPLDETRLQSIQP
jgi:hypothetical protein